MKLFRSALLLLVIGLLFASRTPAQFPAAPGTGPGLPETVEAIDSARVATRILYITAHPDDESAAVLTYLARGLHAEVALMSITRGEGGQNALGPEQAPQLGLIRTQELLAATRGYGVKLYFTRARDFGFSKTPEETERIWGDAVLEDMVRVIREFRPNVVINNWGGVHTGHGHHQLSGIWTPKAVALAADSNAYAELTKEGLRPWNGGSEGVVILDIDRGSDKPKGYILPLDDISPLYGKTWRQIGIDAFVNHHTQGIAGFLNSPFIKRPIALSREDGKPFDAAILAEPVRSEPYRFAPGFCEKQASVCQAFQTADQDLALARTAALALNYGLAVNETSKAAIAIADLLPADGQALSGSLADPVQWETRQTLDRIAIARRLAAGLSFEAIADSADIVIGEPVSFTASYRCRADVLCPVQGPAKASAAGKEFSSAGGASQTELKFAVTLDSAPPAPTVLEQLNPEPPPVITVSLRDVIDSNHQLWVTAPVLYSFASSTHVRRIPVRIVPAYSVAVEPPQTIERTNAQNAPFDLLLRIHSYSTRAARVTVGVNAPDGFKASAPMNLDFAAVGDQYARLTVTPPTKVSTGNFDLGAYVRRGSETFSTSLEPLPSMPAILWTAPALCTVHAFDINVPDHLRVGYISAENEPIPDALRLLGITVEMLDASALEFGDLSKYDSIVVGVRAYELRPELAGANKRLLAYVSDGGTLVVQYNRDYVWDSMQPAPYPAKIGTPTPRITNENSPVKFLKPDDPLLTKPNHITESDFQNWVQERGLYYWSTFDNRYTPLFAMSDPGEKDLNGALVYTHYGKGVYIYTGIAFFRQLPEGVPGAYRLFVNLLSASREK